jgi:hypothetical protein
LASPQSGRHLIQQPEDAYSINFIHAA